MQCKVVMPWYGTFLLFVAAIATTAVGDGRHPCGNQLPALDASAGVEGNRARQRILLISRTLIQRQDAMLGLDPLTHFPEYRIRKSGRRFLQLRSSAAGAQKFVRLACEDHFRLKQLELIAWFDEGLDLHRKRPARGEHSRQGDRRFVGP